MSRRALAYIVLSVGLLALLITFRGALVAWFTGEPLTAEESEHAEHTGPTTPAGEVCEDIPDGAFPPLREAFGAYEEVRGLLARDQINGLAPRAQHLEALLGDARKALPRGSRDLDRHLGEAAEAAGHLRETRTLAEARASFASLSQVLTRLAACEPKLAEGWHLFECSMTSGFNRWMQRGDQVENPYQGAAMQTCGTASDWSPPVTPAATAGDISHWTCPMHPSVRQTGPGKCPICGMDLVPVRRNAQGFGEILLGDSSRELGGITTGVVEVRSLGSEIRAVGRVTFDTTRFEDVTVKYAGYIGRLYVEATGEPVRRGQTLFTLYSPELYAAQQEYLAALESQRAALDTAAPDRADYLVRAARQKLHLWDLSDAQIRELETTRKPVEQIAVPSPASGYVVEKDVVEGAAVQPGMRLYRLAGLDRVWVEAEVYESELPKVRTGQPAVVTLAYLPGEELRGRVSLIYPQIDPESRTGRVRLSIPNRIGSGGPMLKPDMYADVVLQAQQRDALMVPEDAVLYTGPRRIVFVDLGGGRFEPREVRLGAKNEGSFEVLAGLQAGDVVVTSGNFLLDAEARLQSSGGTDHEHGK
jgi:Cu(I)/Ag(I) efflux system membrane fusion protein